MREPACVHVAPAVVSSSTAVPAAARTVEEAAVPAVIQTVEEAAQAAANEAALAATDEAAHVQAAANEAAEVIKKRSRENVRKRLQRQKKKAVDFG